MTGERGFTLIEVLVAVIILSIGFTFIAEGFSQAMNSYERTKNYNYVIGRAEEKLIEYSNGLEYLSHGTFERENRIYDWWIEEEPLPESDNLSKIIITVEWAEGDRQYSIERLYSRER